MVVPFTVQVGDGRFEFSPVSLGRAAVFLMSTARQDNNGKKDLFALGVGVRDG